MRHDTQHSHDRKARVARLAKKRRSDKRVEKSERISLRRLEGKEMAA